MVLNRSVKIGSAVVVAALLLTACGGAPDNASAEDFCAAWTENGNTVEEVHEAAETLEDVGTPEDIEDSARDGFEVFVDALNDVDQDDIEAMDEAVADESSLAEIYGIDEDEAADILALFEYANTTCHDAER
jgi:hypothetical protein